mmetsp:Transcript_108093/g.314404  ORF Transcript_108093/g.314404 Transcript_108093/m.314404 type:complete len:485 (+) Transcript_108093:31-1485(+)
MRRSMAAALAAAALAVIASPTTALSAHIELRPGGTNGTNTNSTNVGPAGDARLSSARRLTEAQSEAPRPATCEHTVFMCKQPAVEQACPHVKPACVRPLFVTGTGFSGTKAAVEIMKYTLPTSIVHENPWSGAQVEVSWCTRCDAKSPAFYNGPPDPPPPDDGGGEGEGEMLVLGQPQQRASRRKRKTFNHFGNGPLDMSDQCLAQNVAHLVRHPLKFIASALKFTVPDVQRETRKPNAVVWATIVDFTPRADPKSDAEFHYIQHPSGERYLRPTLERIMEHWLSWNEHVERVATKRIQIEEFDPLELCELSGVSRDECVRARTEAPCGFVGRNASACCAAAASVAIAHWTHSSNGNVVMSWELLEQANKTLAQAVQRKAAAYGYTKDLPRQRSDTDPVSRLARAGRALYVAPKHRLSAMGKTRAGTDLDRLQRMDRMERVAAAAAARGERGGGGGGGSRGGRDGDSGVGPGLRGARSPGRGRR